ncbi:MAG: hypothetical protein LBH51_01110 [Treponema sp.]|nr:hypothetical protein [Treponema sp.]
MNRPPLFPFPGGGAGGGAVILFLAVLLVFLPSPRIDADSAGAGDARAETEAAAALPPDLGAGMPAEELRRILEQNMGGWRKTWAVRFKNQDRPFPSFREAAARILRAFLIFFSALLVLAAAVFLYRRRRRRFPPAGRPSVVSPRPGPPGLQPPALLEEADRLYRGGLLREAWALCYAASLGALALRWGFRFPPGATEYRCLALVRLWEGQGRLEGAADIDGGQTEAAFARLIHHWVALFYGGLRPPAGAFEDSLAWVGSLCKTPGSGDNAPPGAAGGERG